MAELMLWGKTAMTICYLCFFLVNREDSDEKN